MDPLKHIFVDDDDILADTLNEIQTAMQEVRFANKCTNAVPVGWSAPSSLTTQRVGHVCLLLHHQIAAAGATLLDDVVDWRDRYVDGWIAGEDTDNKRLPGGDAFVSSDSTPTYNGVSFWGYSGLGAAGAPPVRAAGAGQGEVWDLGTWEGANFGGATWGAAQYIVYVDSATGDLYLYNATATVTYVWGMIAITGDIGGF